MVYIAYRKNTIVALFKTIITIKMATEEDTHVKKENIARILIACCVQEECKILDLLSRIQNVNDNRITPDPDSMSLLAWAIFQGLLVFFLNVFFLFIDWEKKRL